MKLTQKLMMILGLFSMSDFAYGARAAAAPLPDPAESSWYRVTPTSEVPVTAEEKADIVDKLRRFRGGGNGINVGSWIVRGKGSAPLCGCMGMGDLLILAHNKVGAKIVKLMENAPEGSSGGLLTGEINAAPPRSSAPSGDEGASEKVSKSAAKPVVPTIISWNNKIEVENFDTTGVDVDHALGLLIGRVTLPCIFYTDKRAKDYGKFPDGTDRPWIGNPLLVGDPRLLIPYPAPEEVPVGVAAPAATDSVDVDMALDPDALAAAAAGEGGAAAAAPTALAADPVTAAAVAPAPEELPAPAPALPAAAVVLVPATAPVVTVEAPQTFWQSMLGCFGIFG